MERIPVVHLEKHIVKVIIIVLETIPEVEVDGQTQEEILVLEALTTQMEEVDLLKGASLTLT